MNPVLSDGFPLLQDIFSYYPAGYDAKKRWTQATWTSPNAPNWRLDVLWINSLPIESLVVYH